MVKSDSFKGRLVYSTDTGRICPDCEKPSDGCRCKEKSKSTIVGDGIIRISRSTKGRKGKGVTIISGVPVTLTELEVLAKALRKKCGSGGTVKNNTIEIQGDHRDFLLRELEKRGWKAKLAGG